MIHIKVFCLLIQTVFFLPFIQNSNDFILLSQNGTQSNWNYKRYQPTRVPSTILQLNVDSKFFLMETMALKISKVMEVLLLASIIIEAYLYTKSGMADHIWKE